MLTICVADFAKSAHSTIMINSPKYTLWKVPHPFVNAPSQQAKFGASVQHSLVRSIRELVEYKETLWISRGGLHERAEQQDQVTLQKVHSSAVKSNTENPIYLRCVCSGEFSVTHAYLSTITLSDPCRSRRGLTNAAPVHTPTDTHVVV